MEGVVISMAPAAECLSYCCGGALLRLGTMKSTGAAEEQDGPSTWAGHGWDGLFRGSIRNNHENK